MAMGQPNATPFIDPNKWLRVNEDAPVIPKQEHLDSPRTLPFQAQLGLHENIDLTISMLQAENAQRQAVMSDLVKKVGEFINPPIYRDKIVMLGTSVAPPNTYPYRKTYPFGPDKWMLEKLTLMPRNGVNFPAWVSIVVEGEDQEPYFLNANIPNVEPEVVLFGGQALIFNTAETTNAGTLLVRWRRLWTIESGHE